MAINLHKKYSDRLAKIYTHNSFVEGHTNTTWSFSGVKSVLIPSIVTKELEPYTRSGNNRYGTPTDVQDTMQELTMKKDEGFSMVIDKGDNTEQQMMKNAGSVMKQQIAERVVPRIDKYALGEWAKNAGKIATASAAPTKNTIIDMLLDAEVHFADHFIPDGDRWVYMSNATYKYVRTAAEFAGSDGIINNMIIKGYKGDIGSLKIVCVPASYMPQNAYFIAAQKNSVILAQKIRDAQIHQDPPGISGHLLEGRYTYDAFVVGTLSDGVYAVVANSAKAATPTATKGESTTALASTTGSATILYTLDGTDPRYSNTAITYTAAFTNPTAGTVIKAVASANGVFNSDLLVHTAA